VHALTQVLARFGSLSLSVAPWFALGVVAAAVVQTFVPQRWAARLLGGRGGLPAAITAGALLPGCSRTTMPLAMGLRGIGGARLGSLTALVFVAPLLSPITVALTWSLLGWRMTLARVIAALAGSALIGAVINRYEPWFEARSRPRIMGADPALDRGCNDHACAPTPTQVGAEPAAFSRLATNAAHTLRRVLPYFLAGMALAATVSALLPEDAIPTALGGASGAWAYLLAAVAGAPLYVCQGEEVPLTYAVLAAGVAPGPALTFLLGSVGMCLPTVVMSRGVLAPRVTYAYIAFWITFAIATGITFQALSQ
jgi:uncharacterized membrane protein YraQ (UPF0718 family)